MRQLTLQPPTRYQMKPAKSVEGVWDEIQAYTRPVLIGEQGYLPDGRPLAVADATGLPSGSFKERGAIAKLRELQQDGVEDVVTASAGNFAAGVALGARALGMRAVVFVPEGTPSVKLANITAIGGKQVEVACAGSSFEQAYQAAQCYGNEHDLPLVEPLMIKQLLSVKGRSRMSCWSATAISTICLYLQAAADCWLGVSKQ